VKRNARLLWIISAIGCFSGVMTFMNCMCHLLS